MLIKHMVCVAALVSFLVAHLGCMSPKRADWAVRTEADRTTYRVTRNSSLFHCKEFVENGQNAINFFYQDELWPTFLPAVIRDLRIWWTGISNDTGWLVTFYAQNAFLSLLSSLSAGLTDQTAKMNMDVCLLYAQENYFKKGMAYMFREQAQNIVNIVNAKEDPAEWRPFMQRVRDAIDIAGNGSIYFTESNRTIWTNRFGEWLGETAIARGVPACIRQQMLDSWMSTPSSPEKVELPKSVSAYAEYIISMKDYIEEVAQHVYNVIMKNKKGWDNDPKIIAPEFTKAKHHIGVKARDESDWRRFFKLMTERLRAEQIINQIEIDGALRIMQREHLLEWEKPVETKETSVEEKAADESWKVEVSRLADKLTNLFESTDDRSVWETEANEATSAIMIMPEISDAETQELLDSALDFFNKEVRGKASRSKLINQKKLSAIKEFMDELFATVAESSQPQEKVESSKTSTPVRHDEH